MLMWEEIFHDVGGEVRVSGLESLQKNIRDFLGCFEAESCTLLKLPECSQGWGKNGNSASQRQVGTVTRPSVFIEDNKQPVQG